MASTPQTGSTSVDAGVPAKQVYAAAGTCLVVGLAIGYFFLGSHATPSVARSNSAAGAPNAAATYNGVHPQLTIEQMKQMADVQASSLIEKSKTEPKNAGLLVQIAGIYQASHQFKEAAGYFEKALSIDPKNVSARTEMASCLYYSGDADGAVAQLNQVLKSNPKDANALFNIGMIKYRGKKDPAGAVAAWQQLLKANPNLDRKPVVEQMIAEAKATETKN
ncbi:MAG: tetratricopeptide repeat protein [Candidatus Acidiferrum sp.]